jgi:hypothetical protein
MAAANIALSAIMGRFFSQMELLRSTLFSVPLSLGQSEEKTMETVVRTEGALLSEGMSAASWAGIAAGAAARKPARTNDRRSRGLLPSSPDSQAFVTSLGNGERHPGAGSGSLGYAVGRAGGLVRETAGVDVLSRDRAERTAMRRVLVFRPAVEHVGPAASHRFM